MRPELFFPHLVDSGQEHRPEWSQQGESGAVIGRFQDLWCERNPYPFSAAVYCTDGLWFNEGSTGVFLVHSIFAFVQDAVFSCRSISRSTAVRVGALPRFSSARSIICEVQLIMSWSSWLVFPEDLDFCSPSFPFNICCQMCVWCLKFSATICWSALSSLTTRACRCRVSRALFDRYLFSTHYHLMWFTAGQTKLFSA